MFLGKSDTYSRGKLPDRCVCYKIMASFDMNEDLLLIKRLETMRDQHRELDEKIKLNGLDEFSKQRFKKMKLQLRDEIIRLEQLVYPDIIA